jgi:hypothetical protein
MTPEEWDTLDEKEQEDDLEQALAGIRDELREETSKSRFRDNCSRRRKHPIDNDFNKLLDFIIDRRRREPRSTFDAARIVLGMGDPKVNRPQAIRLLVSVVLAPGVRGGSCGWLMRRRCKRLLEYCDTIEAALAWKERPN